MLMHLSSSKLRLAILVAMGGLTVSACGSSSTDTVDNSEITELNAAGMAEGTISDASAVETATDTNIEASSAPDNGTAEAGNTATNTADGNSAE